MEVTTKTIEAASTDSAGWKAASSDASSTEVAAMGLNLLSGVASLPTFYYELSRHGCWPDALSRQAFLHALSRQACRHGCCKRVLRVGRLVPLQMEALLQEMREQLQDDKDQLNVGCFAVPVPHFGWYTLGRARRHFFIFS